MTILNIADNTEYAIEPLIDDVSEAFKRGSLTFDQAVLMHQLMWSWIYDEFCCSGCLMKKKDFWEAFGLDSVIGGCHAHCFFCIYSRNQYLKSTPSSIGISYACDFCPGIWCKKIDAGDDVFAAFCSRSKTSPYRKFFELAKRKLFYDPEAIKKSIRDIATIKIREKCMYDK